MPRLTDLQFRLEYAALRLLVAIVRAFPLDTAVAISARIWRWVARLDKRRHARALANLAIAFPEKSARERERIALRMWENLGRVMAETMQLDRILADPARIEIIDPHVFNRYRDKDGGIIGVTLHTGNWELAVYPLSAGGKTPAAVYRLVKNPYVDRYLRAQRRHLYPGGLFGKGKAFGNEEARKTARLIMDYVRQGGQLGLVCDLFDKKGLAVPFFGQPARSTPAAAMIARRTGARIWIGRTIRQGKGSNFKIEFKELKVPRTANQGDDIKAATAAMQAQFEAWVREYPEQWMWSNRRWS